MAACPVRTGTVNWEAGDVFLQCGSGDFAADAALTITDQIDSQIDALCETSDSQIYCLFSGIHEYVCTGRIPSKDF